MKKKKPINKRPWFWIVIIAAIGLAVVNIVFACAFEGEHSNLFTAISGWVSGIATAVLGFIAVAQTERYENDNKEYLEKQQNIQQQIVEENKKQNNIAIRLTEYQRLSEYYNRISEDLLSFVSEGIGLSVKTTVFDCYEKYDNKIVSAVNELGQYLENKRMGILAMALNIRASQYSFKSQNDLVISLYELSDELFKCDKYCKHFSDWDFLKNNLGEDADTLLKLNLRVIELTKDFLFDIQAALYILQDEQNSFEECKALIEKLTKNKIDNEKKLDEYMRNQFEENKDKPVENG
ncbi:MAG: hypothetical protein IJ872_01675 [Eubacterium sp.]|nr:hypothetical protein [Eubacterium sp.]